MRVVTHVLGDACDRIGTAMLFLARHLAFLPCRLMYSISGVVHARGMDVYDPAKRLRVGDQASPYMGTSPAR